ncbi:MAG: [ribosomal protein S5]-alanine N-acetyltransferase [Actinomycetota bacterium]|jgi:ribosomal-protein-alanine N-acetyltransferase|nr:[ribosomal protein S5]-alanine N-acetyltransferase [Actinomycetota bacterium]
MARGWPVALQDGRVGLRPLRMRDAAAWSEVRTRNERWLSPWEGRPESQPATSWAERHSPVVFTAMLRNVRREARAGRTLPLAITYDGRLAGQLTASNVVRGAFDSASVGYWVDGALAGRGVLPTALAMLVDHCFQTAGLHRIEANIRPENTASRRVVEKLGFREEGLHLRYLFIDGGWRDHLSFAVTREDVPEGMQRRWHAARTSAP